MRPRAARRAAARAARRGGVERPLPLAFVPLVGMPEHVRRHVAPVLRAIAPLGQEALGGRTIIATPIGNGHVMRVGPIDHAGAMNCMRLLAPSALHFVEEPLERTRARLIFVDDDGTAYSLGFRFGGLDDMLGGHAG